MSDVPNRRRCRVCAMPAAVGEYCPEDASALGLTLTTCPRCRSVFWAPNRIRRLCDACAAAQGRFTTRVSELADDTPEEIDRKFAAALKVARGRYHIDPWARSKSPFEV